MSVTDYFAGGPVGARYSVEVTLADPYTYRATAIANVTGQLVAIALFALGLAVVVSAGLARRFTTPLRQLTDASRDLAEGDLTRRVPAAQLRAGSSELGELAVQFNTMADRLEESVEIIRRDRDRSRDFLADVSHELRTPLAALRTFNQLLIETAGDDPDARAEFIESSAGQIERLDCGPFDGPSMLQVGDSPEVRALGSRVAGQIHVVPGASKGQSAAHAHKPRD
jgi:signal transduction histidine kinase